MTREEAIRILDPETTREAISKLEYYAGFRGEEAVRKAVDDACILAVTALLEQEERRWIPVTERLPDRNSTVLAFYEIMRGTSTKIQVSKGWGIYGDVTHWMPLPEPPKEEGQ